MATVLLVDDDAEVLATLERCLKADRHDVLTASSGLAAVELLEGHPEIELLLTDVIMPGLNGFNLARMARLRRPSVKVLYITGYYERAAAERDPGPWEGKLLTKPIMPADLQQEVRAALAPD